MNFFERWWCNSSVLGLGAAKAYNGRHRHATGLHTPPPRRASTRHRRPRDAAVSSPLRLRSKLGKSPPPPYDRYAALRPLAPYFSILNNPTPPPSLSERAAANAGKAPAFTLAVLAWVGGSRAGSMKTGGAEVAREKWDEANTVRDTDDDMDLSVDFEEHTARNMHRMRHDRRRRKLEQMEGSRGNLAPPKHRQHLETANDGSRHPRGQMIRTRACA
ncbi:hypothetical protein LshimejAT787_1300650 [Lyophyllum shimeji]|uniref:Uncharacterized protein n=1 Tax=Lyophyllum shimeji TaxID=47721 RepID=A0A9P3PX13_LYOSH|nr:hypothetical protein LshimejAT787_1300590 [Lyophyllum shimeji]GLB43164.1 hypothetical protein LshimejAT787_1300650 [Lyophyllum shimeji]